MLEKIFVTGFVLGAMTVVCAVVVGTVFTLSPSGPCGIVAAIGFGLMALSGAATLLREIWR